MVKVVFSKQGRGSRDGRVGGWRRFQQQLLVEMIAFSANDCCYICNRSHSYSIARLTNLRNNCYIIAGEVRMLPLITEVHLIDCN